MNIVLIVMLLTVRLSLFIYLYSASNQHNVCQGQPI